MRSFRISDFDFEHQTALIIGSGPTHFDYRRIKDHHGPVILINDSIKLANLTSNNPWAFFFTLHVDHFRQWFDPPHLIVSFPRIYLYLLGREVNQMLNFEFDYYKQLDLTGHRSLDRSLMLSENMIYCYENSTDLALHFLYLTGCKSVRIVGSGPLDGDFQDGHDPRLGGEYHKNGNLYYQHANAMCDLYGFDYKHLGCDLKIHL